MHVFVTGATGFIGSAIVKELIATGHSVTGLVRSNANARILAQTGAKPHRGDLDDLDSLRRGAEGADGVIHTAFNHDFSTYRDNCAADRGIIAALGSVLAGSNRPLLVTSGIGILPAGSLLTEDVLPATGAAAHPRAASEQAAVALLDQGVNAGIVRLPPSVHGAGDHGFVPHLIATAKRTGVAAYIGDGANRWPAVHRFDAARLYRLALENAVPGARWHGVAEEGVGFRDIAALIARRLDLPLVSTGGAAAAAHFGWMSGFAAMDVPSSSAQTRAKLGWQPVETGLLADMEGSDYFAA
ncbi:SDR family oxidoreductase [Niveispirillum sp. KHB5.9]|uniref:SDR family oxidoreductase n=1 Tax=Niveispirillum sp. KHB5.9 TaxID=3400269 RepID=UPI003A8620FC